MSVTIKKFHEDAFLTGIQMGFETWFEPLLPILKTLYFRDLASKITNRYLEASSVRFLYPKQRGDVFKAFRSTKWDDLKIVILGHEPYPHNGCTGLAFANPLEKENYPSPALRIILDNVEKTFYNGLNLDKDVTLETWCEQGVLLLNSSLTIGNMSESHERMWRPFTQRVLETISEKKEGIIFMFWGQVPSSFKGWVDSKKHHVLEAEHPLKSFYLNKEWDCNHFEVANSILQDRGDKLIKW